MTLFRDGDPTLFDGDLNDEDDVLDFLTADRHLSLPEKIEEVTGEGLMALVNDKKGSEESYVTVLFVDGGAESEDVLEELENIDDEAEVFSIR